MSIVIEQAGEGIVFDNMTLPEMKELLILQKEALSKAAEENKKLAEENTELKRHSIRLENALNIAIAGLKLIKLGKAGEILKEKKQLEDDKPKCNHCGSPNVRRTFEGQSMKGNDLDYYYCNDCKQTFLIVWI